MKKTILCLLVVSLFGCSSSEELHVYDGQGNNLGELWGVESTGSGFLYQIYNPKLDIVFSLQAIDGEVGLDGDFQNSFDPNCNVKTPTIYLDKYLPPEWCDENLPVPSPRPLHFIGSFDDLINFEISGNFVLETGYEWKEVFYENKEGICMSAGPSCVAKTEKIEFPRNFQLPISVQ